MATEQQETQQVRTTTAAGRYSVKEAKRTPFLQRARDAAALTIPGIMPPQGHTGAQSLPQPRQSAGADGANNLSAKLLMVLFPPGSGFFKLEMDDFLVEKLSTTAQANGQDEEDARATFEKALAKCERAVVTKMERKGTRTVNFEALQHLVICGNGLIHVMPNGREKFFPLDRYVVTRDLDGDVLEIIVKECLDRAALPAKIRAILKDQPTDPDSQQNEKNVDLYTWIKRIEDGSWTIHQEVEGSIISGTEGTYPKDLCPWLPLRWRAVPGEDYGRGRVEEYMGDVTSTEGLQKAINEFAAQAAKVLWFVDPSGSTDADEVAKAPNGAVLNGNAKDISALMLEKSQDFQVASANLTKVEKRLERAFLQASAVQRDAERVTAEEIRAMVGELEQGLGGVYTILAEEFQRPLAAIYMHQMIKAKELPQLPKDVVSPQIVTGLEGLGRQTDAQKLRTLFQDVSSIFGPEAAAQWANIAGYITRQGAAIGVDTSGVVRSAAEVQQEQQSQAQHEMVNKLGPTAIKAASDSQQQQQEQQGQ